MKKLMLIVAAVAAIGLSSCCNRNANKAAAETRTECAATCCENKAECRAQGENATECTGKQCAEKQGCCKESKAACEGKECAQGDKKCCDKKCCDKKGGECAKTAAAELP